MRVSPHNLPHHTKNASHSARTAHTQDASAPPQSPATTAGPSGAHARETAATQDNFTQAPAARNGNGAVREERPNRQSLRQSHRARHRSAPSATEHQSRTQGSTEAGSNGAAANLPRLPVVTQNPGIQEQVAAADLRQLLNLLSDLATYPRGDASARIQSGYIDAINQRLAQSNNVSESLSNSISQGVQQLWRGNGDALQAAMNQIPEGRGTGIISDLQNRNAVRNGLREVFNGWTPNPGANSQFNLPESLRQIGASLSQEGIGGNQTQAANNVVSAVSENISRMWRAGGTSADHVLSLMHQVQEMRGPGSSEARALVAQATGHLLNERSEALRAGNLGPIQFDNPAGRHISEQQLAPLASGLSSLVRSDATGIYGALENMDRGGPGRRPGDLGIDLNRALLRSPEGQATLGRANAQLIGASLTPYQDSRLPESTRQRTASDLGYFTGTAMSALRGHGLSVDQQIQAQRNMVDAMSQSVNLVPGAGSYLRQAVQYLNNEVATRAQSANHESVNSMIQAFENAPQQAFGAMRAEHPQPQANADRFWDEYHRNYNNYWVSQQQGI